MMQRATAWTAMAVLTLCLLAMPAAAQEAVQEDRSVAPETAQPSPEAQLAPAPAQPGEPAPAAPAEPAPLAPDGDVIPPRTDQSGPSAWLPLVMIGVLVLLFVFMGRKPRKQEQQRKAMLANIKKGDRVTTIGGIVGTVMDVRGDDLTVKVDESTNTRMRFAVWAIRNVGDGSAEQETR